MIIDTSKAYSEPESSTEVHTPYQEETPETETVGYGGGDLVCDETDETDTYKTQFFEEFDEVVTPIDEPAEPQKKNSFFDDPQPKQESGYVKRTNETVAGYIVKAFDEAMSFSLSRFVAKSGKPEKYKATTKDLSDITEVVKQLMPKTHVPISPMAQLGIVLVKAYGGKVDIAMKDRKIAELESEIERLKAESQKRDIELKDERIAEKRERRQYAQYERENIRKKTSKTHESVPDTRAAEAEFSI